MAIEKINFNVVDEKGTNLNRYTIVEDGSSKVVKLERNANLTRPRTKLNKSFFDNFANKLNDNFESVQNKIQEVYDTNFQDIDFSVEGLLGQIKRTREVSVLCDLRYGSTYQGDAEDVLLASNVSDKNINRTKITFSSSDTNFSNASILSYAPSTARLAIRVSSKIETTIKVKITYYINVIQEVEDTTGGYGD